MPQPRCPACDHSLPDDGRCRTVDCGYIELHRPRVDDSTPARRPARRSRAPGARRPPRARWSPDREDQKAAEVGLAGFRAALEHPRPPAGEDPERPETENVNTGGRL